MNYIRFNEFGEIVKRDIRGIVATSDYADIIYIFYDNDINTAESSYQAYARVLRVDGYVVGPAILTLTSIAFDTEEDALLYGTPTYNEITEKYDVPCRTLTLTNEMLAVKGDLGISIIYNQILESGKKITDVNQQIAIKVFEAVEELYTEDEYNELLDLFLPKDLSGLVDTTNFGLTDKFLLRQSGSTKIISGANLILYATADIVSGVQKLKKISLDTVAPAESLNIGETRWNAEAGTDETRLSASVVRQNGRELVVRAKNNTAHVIANGQPVYVSGASGSSPNWYIDKASSNNDSHVLKLIGMATEDILAGAFGYICIYGEVNGINTSAFEVNDVLYLGTTAGTITNVRPNGLTNIVILGTCIRKHSSEGAILLRTQIIPKLANLSGVRFTDLTEGEVPIWNGTYWENFQIDSKFTDTNAKNLEQDGRLTTNESAIANLEDGTTVIPTYELKANKNVANGYVGLDTNAKIPLIFLYDVVLGQLEWAGSFNPNSGYPTQTNALNPNRAIRKGDYFIANANGTISGVEYNTGDWAIRSASDWQKIDNTDAVASVNGKIGIVNLTGADINVSGSDTTKIATKIDEIMTALNDRYLKSQVYTKTEIDAIIEQIKSLYDLEISTLYDGEVGGINVDYANITGTNFVIMEVETEYTLDEGITFKKQTNTFTITTNTLTIAGYNQHFSIYNKDLPSVVFNWFELYNNAGYLDYYDGGGSSTIQSRNLKLTAYKMKPLTAENMGYDNSLSGLTADNVQEAIDELDTQVKGVNTQLSETEQEIMSFKEEYMQYLEMENGFNYIRLPNGVCDKIDGDKIIKKIQSYIIKDGDITNITIVSSSELINLVVVQNTFIDSTFANNKMGNILLKDRLQVADNTINYTVYNIGNYFTANSKRVAFIVDKNMTLAEAKTEFVGLEILYELAEPEILDNVNLTKNTKQVAKITGNVDSINQSIRKVENITLGDINVPAKHKSRAIVSFISDDGKIEDYTILKPIFESEGVPFSPAVVSDSIGLEGQMTLEQIKELQSNGCEIMSHSKNHVPLATLTESEIEEQLSVSKQTLNNLGLKVNNIVYPNGSYNNLVKKIARKYYRSGYLFMNATKLNTQPYDTYALNRISLGAYFNAPTSTYPITNTFEDYYKKMVDLAVEEDKWLIITLHPGASNGDFIEQQRLYLIETIQYIKSLGLEIKNPNEVLDEMGNLIDVASYSQDNVTESGFKIGGDGSLSVDNDTTAKLDVSNVFTQPQQVPNATLPQHTTNLSQVETMFEMFKRELRGYNLAIPDLTDKTEISEGVYRIKDSTNYKLDYEISTGIWIYNSKIEHQLNDYIFTIGELYPNIMQINQDYYLKIIPISAHEGFDYQFRHTSGTPSISLYNEGIVNIQILGGAGLRLISDNVINPQNITFKLQIEKGSTATPYTVPGQIPQYKIVGEE